MLYEVITVLRKARAAERETRTEILGRNIELAVAAEDVHHFAAVDPDRLADAADLVRKCDLERVPGVVGVFHHFRSLEIGHGDRHVDAGVHLRQHFSGAVVTGREHDLRRAVKIGDRRAFAQEFREKARITSYNVCYTKLLRDRVRGQ